MRRIAIVTSGGDAPGMNAAIRAIVRTAYPERLKIYGFRRGFEGTIYDNKVELDPRVVGGIIHLGGKANDFAERSKNYDGPLEGKILYDFRRNETLNTAKQEIKTIN